MSATDFDQLPVHDRLMACLGGFIQGFGISIPLDWQIVERAIADDPAAPTADIKAKACAWILIPLASE